MTKPFFAPIPTTFSRPLGQPPSDAELLRAWRDVTDDALRAGVPPPMAPVDYKFHEAAVEARARVRRLRGLA